jgi:SAM-dependent methyltransferase
MQMENRPPGPGAAPRARPLRWRALQQVVRLVRPLDYRRVDECRLVLEWLDPSPGDRILDVGCGDGFYDYRMAARGAAVDAIDARPQRIARALKMHPHPRVTYHSMVAGALAFPDRTFEKAVSICVLEHIEDDAGALREMRRVVRPGGRLVLSCDSLSNPGISDRLRTAHARRYAVRHFYTPASLGERLRQAGFELLRTQFVLTTAVSLAIVRLTYAADDIGRVPLGWMVKYPVLGLAGVAGLPVSRASESVGARREAGLTLVAEARAV